MSPTVPVRDRRGRGPRGPLTPASIPRARTRSALFDAAVLDAYAPLAERYHEQLAHLDLAVDTVPRMRMSADLAVLSEDVVADGPVPLGRLIPAAVDGAGRPTRARMVLFRMPISRRAADVESRRELLTTVLTALVAEYLNMDPRDVDPDFQW
ncbi:metallopeptidase family protein [Corynebacterium uberis]|uniref:metallopeptidase family protein n=1 Tax=Corynebacterium TaxID=1716 RepID=UPI001D09B25A|nr:MULTISPECIES: metallopeptidase family protein [Corynebacterium]MCZ9309239.1 metallopeptidase family protein [Corynebacterium sp. c6VSa_13]UDL72796.1 metallopeptidase family protein [Corynebacterium uberis]UDL76327.1 metallopeptidase family protein [Corynebacterium uberis]UDL78539.1 metallopeptidase family protein [Corynebacterium uberis]UDL80820.1 metallopeptidase family protein [Corynebacterium uberis]